ncbi:hypothetical protein A2814_00705 [Candidatus Nomurabacteria bacterium RIFCSPHIGHO2_01_FULL_38_19]|uniref:Uncharacterized protein n=1 Tax=Candidatus Nomurabacteria bacterium RIFCSPHIGHO2_01_FULL_38_19 TaxID=1801732 RepID=A0A1F6UVI8_9BACT|nr:MAG: hypothetical protein A2814_00705 [Candidatus Nomurabacteria bacterium RIFCSPHIGHO2_01_FULL_38_19]
MREPFSSGTNADSAGRNNWLGIWIRPASALFPPAGWVWGGMRAGFGLGVSDFKNSPLDFVPIKLAHRRYYSNKDTNQYQIF